MNRPFAFCCRVVVMWGLCLGPGAVRADWNLKDWVDDPAGEAERKLEEAQRLAREAEQRAREAAASSNAESRAKAAQASEAAVSATQRASEATAALGRLWEDWQKKLPTAGGGAGSMDGRAFQQQAEQARVSLQRKWSELQQQLNELGRLDHQSPKELMRKAEQQAERALAAVKNYEGLLAQVQGFMQSPTQQARALDWFKRLPFTNPMPDILAMNSEGIGVLLTYLVGFWVLRRLLFGKRR